MSQRIGIAGAGLLGRLLAWELSRAGHDVDVFDPASGPGPRDASGSLAAGFTAAGMLSPVAELERADENVFRLGLRSCALWPGIVQALGEPVPLAMEGSLLLAHRGDAGAAERVIGLLKPRADAAHQPQPVSPEQLRALEPGVNGPALAWLLPGEGVIHPPLAMQTLAAQAVQRGARFHWQCRVTRVEPGRLTCAHADGRLESADFDHVFDVRGLGARPDLPVRGVRGEIFWLHAPGVVLKRPVRLLHPRHSVYLVPRPGDVIVVGASEIESEDRSGVSLRSTVELLSAAHSVIPELAEARIVHSETNLRPALPDNLPLLETASGITRINGLFRHGWLLAPALVEDALQQLDATAGEVQRQLERSLS